MDIALISASYEGLKIGKAALQSLFDAKVDSEAKEKIDLVLQKLGDAQDTLFSMREELFRLQEENERLRRQAASMAQWDEIKSRYILQSTEGGAIVYVSTGDPQHYACPSCFNSKELHFLQDRHVMSGEFKCTGCDSTYPVKKERSFSMPSTPRRR
ncbi:hypothetical protein [Spongiibacter sp. UBA1325]|uniref:hypothetical protein n=1 Tax=Spongiibacter sp. UBA1325 TaxID=1947543 RepID=UPI00257C04D1|nr:hypothetical protein [Spongiibacter sp. UBA1325]